MLDKNYDDAIVGLNYISLIYGLIQLKNKKSVLLIDEKELIFADKWYANISLIEIGLLKDLGKKHNIQPLLDIEKYLTPKNSILNLDGLVIEFSHSPYANIRELARKVPSMFNDFYRQALVNVDSDVFDQDFFELIDLIVKSSYNFYEQGKLSEILSLNQNKELFETLERFLKYIKEDGFQNKQIHFILQVANQTIFSSKMFDLESKILLLKTLSPRFEFNLKQLISDLIFEFRKNGGDYKQCSINDWGISNNNLSYLLLDSLDGVIKVDSTCLFGNILSRYPFVSKFDQNKYLSISLEGIIDHEFKEQFCNKRIIFSNEERMGSDFPFWEAHIDLNGNLKATYAYADYQGSKDTFYYTHCIEDIFNSIKEILPGLSRADFISSVKLTGGHDTWYDVGSKKIGNPTPQLIDSFKYLNSTSNNQRINGLQNFGTLRSQSLGFYTYLLDLFAV